MGKTLAVVLLLVLAGCSGPSVEESDTVETTEAITTTPPATPVRTPPPTTTAEPTDSNTIYYSNLTTVQQNAFDRAIDGRSQFLDRDTINSSYVDGDYFVRSAAKVFAANEYVVKDGVVHQIKYDNSAGSVYASYLIRATEEDPGDDATVVQFGSLSQEARDPVESAIQNGSHGVPPGKWDSLPQDISDADFVEYDGSTYRLSVVYGDEFASVLQVEKAE